MNAGVTPNQSGTRLEIDVPETVCIDSAWGASRKGSAIAALAANHKGVDGPTSRRMRYWSTGAWTLAPVQETYAFTSEVLMDDFQPSQFQYGHPDAMAALVVENAIARLDRKLWSEPVGVGFTHHPGTAYVGDYLITKLIEAGTSWAATNPIGPGTPQTQTGTSIIAGVPEFAGENVPMDTLVFTGETQPADQPYFLRWLSPGIALSTPDSVLNFYFGQYCLMIGGDGIATIAEYCHPKGGGAKRWRKRDSFRYCRQGRAVGVPHSLVIYPQHGPQHQRYIVFAGNEMDTGRSNAVLSTGPRDDGTPVNDEYLFEPNDLIRFGDPQVDPDAVTCAAPNRLDMRRDLRIAFNFSRLVFFNTGGIKDFDWQLPDYSVRTIVQSDYAANPLQCIVQADLPLDPVNSTYPTIETSITDTITGSTADIHNAGIDFVFHGTGPSETSYSYSSPIMWGYRLFRPATNRTVNPGMMSMDVKSATLEGIAGPDPRQERGQVLVQDTENVNGPRLTNRGRLSARLVLDYTTDDGSTTVPVVLARGFAVRPKATKRGKPRSEYPAEEWRDYSLLFSGISDRASWVSGRSIDFSLFDTDPNAPEVSDADRASGIMQRGTPGWKITDIIRYLLLMRGFPDDQVIIADNPIRLWSTSDTYQDDHVYDASVDVIAKCVALAKNYLGAYLIWDVNAGPLDSAITGDSDDVTAQGAWRLVFPPDPLGAPIWNFVTAPQNVSGTAGHTFLPHGGASYAANTTFIADNLVSTPIPAEANHIWVFAAPQMNGTKGLRYERHLFNPKSYVVPSMPFVLDPTSCHYWGEEKMLIVPAPNCYTGDDTIGPDSPTQKAVDFTARRLFNYACLPRFTVSARAPLVLVADAETAHLRPLRYYDAVTINGDTGWYVRSVSPDIRSINHMATYEFEKTVGMDADGVNI